MEAQFLVRTPDVSENQLSFVGNKLQRIFGLAHVSKVDPFIRRIERILLPDMPELAIQVFLQGAAHIQLANCSDGPNCTRLRMLDNQKAARASLIAAARAVTHLSFGAENPDCLTDSIIDMILEEPEAFKLSLKKHLAEGFSFVEARARAADEIIPGSARVLAGSNNTLALAYMARIKKKSYALEPLPVLREGAAYNSERLEEISSAAAIRRALRDGRTEEAFASMPEASARIFKRALADGRLCLDYENWRRLLRALLLHARPEELRGFAEISEGIEYKLRDEALSARSFEEWLDRCTSKRYPAGRLRRAAVHIALGLGHWFNRAAQRLGPPYIRPLAMNETGRALLHEMKKNAALPIVTTYGQASRLSPYAAECARFELLACELWEELVPNGRFGEEHKRRLIIA